MKVSIITGAASGIGLALSQVCLQKGYITVMVDKNKSKLTEESSNLEKKFPHLVHNFHADITIIKEVEQLVSFITLQFGRAEWIFNNAGIIGKIAPLWELEPLDIKEVLDVNLIGMFNMIKAFIPMLSKQNFRSHIINMASLYALSSGSQLVSYSISKHAVLALTESLYYDLQSQKKPIDLSIVFPSFTNTSLLNNKKNASAFHSFLNSLLTHSKEALETAEYIIKKVEDKQFYIFPDKEVITYCKARIEALISVNNPHINEVEQLISALGRRKQGHQIEPNENQSNEKMLS